MVGISERAKLLNFLGENTQTVSSLSDEVISSIHKFVSDESDV
jgi:hypothetical protein